MRAAVIKESHEVSIVSVADPAPGPREVVVDVAACGICGTDLHILEGEFAPSLPIIPGHEFAGVVVATGTDVTELAEGQRVAVDPSLYCSECHYCRLGRGNLCERWNAIGVSMPGGAAEFAVAPVANCRNVPPGLTRGRDRPQDPGHPLGGGRSRAGRRAHLRLDGDLSCPQHS